MQLCNNRTHPLPVSSNLKWRKKTEVKLSLVEKNYPKNFQSTVKEFNGFLRVTILRILRLTEFYA